MKIQEFISQLMEGEALNDEQRKFAEQFDINSIAAAVRKKSESNAAEAVKRAEDAEARLASMEPIAKLIGDQDPAAFLQEITEGRQQLESHSRGTAIGSLINFKVTAGVSQQMVQRDLEARFKDVPTGEIATLGPDIIKTFVSENQALILDETGGGSGINRPASPMPLSLSGIGGFNPNTASDEEMTKWIRKNTR